jgi:hypothetical protein
MNLERLVRIERTAALCSGSRLGMRILSSTHLISRDARRPDRLPAWRP